MKPYYEDEHATLYAGDCLEVLAALPRRIVDTVLTDPPYSSGGRRESARSVRKSMTRGTSDDDWIAGDAMSTAGFVWTMREFAVRTREVMKVGGHLLSFIDWRMYPNLVLALETADLRQMPTLVWDKVNFGMGSQFRNRHEWIAHFAFGTPVKPQRRDVANVLAFPAVRKGDHPTEKPGPLLETLISVVTPVGGVVLDPFAGSGSTLCAAKTLGRKSIGIELDERFAEVAAKRLERTPWPGDVALPGSDELSFEGIA